jgi:hypothetical protein
MWVGVAVVHWLLCCCGVGASGWVAYNMWVRVAVGAAPVPSGILLAVSAALCVFCVYNVLAGGNPPPAKKAA